MPTSTRAAGKIADRIRPAAMPTIQLAISQLVVSFLASRCQRSPSHQASRPGLRGLGYQPDIGNAHDALTAS